jgi:phospholipase C
MSSSESAVNALDHVVVVLFENRSFDNLLGHRSASRVNAPFSR